MERISIFNYEAFYLDYLEGRLNQEDSALLLLFLESHPELIVEDGLDSFAIDENELSAITLFPNPTRDFLTVSGLSNNQNFSWQIIDLIGRELKQDFANAENTEIDVQNLATGVYILILEHQKAVKFIKE